MPFENIDVPEQSTEIIGKGAEEAMNALLVREDLVLAEAQDIVDGGLQTLEFTHRNEHECCDFINTWFPDLQELQLLTK